jgi:glyceraldehyde-3-phosphate dehydrogenase (NAD(P))
MAEKRIVHVVGTGTIGEPLIGFYTDFKAKWGIDEVTFHKRTPKTDDHAMVEHLIGRGAKLVVDDNSRPDFEELGHRVSFTTEEALARATVVVDCTPAGMDNKNKYYKRIKGPKGYIAQGSEFGFGKPYAWGINDSALAEDDRFIQVVSCNTHNISILIQTIAGDGNGGIALENGRFVCMRRANDVSDTQSFLAAPKVGIHDDPDFGTHHARDAYHLFATLGEKLNLYSSALKLNTQYMHTLWFDLELGKETTLEQVKAALRHKQNVAITNKRAANQIFSFGRDHGYFGRILSQAVVPVSTLAVPNPRRVVGFCFTPQDGNSLVSSIVATLRFLDPSRVDQDVAELRPYFFREI